MKLFLTLAATALLASPAFGQDPSVPIVWDVKAPWTHQNSGIVFPATIGSFARTEIRQLGTGEIDVSIGYRDAATRTTLTYYTFRAYPPVVPIWVDRIDAAMRVSGDSGRLGGPLSGSAKITAFASAGHSVPTGLRTVYAVGGGKTAATGAAAVSAGDWLLTVRMTSAMLDREGFDATLLTAVSALSVPPPPSGSLAVAPIEACGEPLKFKQAKRAKPDMTDALFSGLIASMSADVEDKLKEEGAEKETPITFCRDQSSNASFGVYRNVADTGSYLMALGDAGVAIDVQPSLNSLLGDRKKPRFDVRLHMPTQTYSFTPFLSLPTPQQVFEAANSERPIASSDRAGTISISP